MKLSPAKIRVALIEKGKMLGLRLPQMQLLLAQERFMARLAKTEYAQKFVWKGGSIILRLYKIPEITRFTVDLDLLLNGLKIGDVAIIFKKCCDLDLKDGFDFSNVRSTQMLRETPYGGERFEIDWKLNNKGQSESLKIDVCAGDDVDAKSYSTEDLYLLNYDDKNLSFLVYPSHFIFAEKFETAYSFGTGNTRAKDYIDMWILIKYGLDRSLVKESINRCFSRRGTEYDPKEWERIINSEFLTEFMDKQIKRHFQKLNLPETKLMFMDIKEFINSL